MSLCFQQWLLVSEFSEWNRCLSSRLTSNTFKEISSTLGFQFLCSILRAIKQAAWNFSLACIWCEKWGRRHPWKAGTTRKSNSVHHLVEKALSRTDQVFTIHSSLSLSSSSAIPKLLLLSKEPTSKCKSRSNVCKRKFYPSWNMPTIIRVLKSWRETHKAGATDRKAAWRAFENGHLDPISREPGAVPPLVWREQCHAFQICWMLSCRWTLRCTIMSTFWAALSPPAEKGALSSAT